MKIKFIVLMSFVFFSSCTFVPNKETINNIGLIKKNLYLNKEKKSQYNSLNIKQHKEIRSLANSLNSKYIVFIDPGHGGKDPGAISPKGNYEKHITLRASKILKKSLLKFKNIKVFMSRHNDKYLYLRDRINLAHKVKADLFLSIHADASKNKKARGISVFSLSNIASDAEAKKLARRENKSDFVGNIKLKNNDPLVVGNLIKIFQRETMNQSSEFAKFVLNDMTEYSLYNRGHRFAGFAVLKSPQIPSILIELGFLTNANDEKKLLSSKYLANLCDTISISIVKFLKIREK